MNVVGGFESVQEVGLVLGECWMNVGYTGPALRQRWAGVSRRPECGCWWGEGAEWVGCDPVTRGVTPWPGLSSTSVPAGVPGHSPACQPAWHPHPGPHYPPVNPRPPGPNCTPTEPHLSPHTLHVPRLPPHSHIYTQYSIDIPADARHASGVGSMLGQRRRRCPSIDPTPDSLFVFPIG